MDLADILSQLRNATGEEIELARGLIVDLVWISDIAFHKMAVDILGPDATKEAIDNYVDGVVREALYEYVNGVHTDA